VPPNDRKGREAVGLLRLGRHARRLGLGTVIRAGGASLYRVPSREDGEDVRRARAEADGRRKGNGRSLAPTKTKTKSSFRFWFPGLAICGLRVEPGPWPDRRAGDGVAVAADGSVRGRQ
jgi:hypothetical protein